MSWRILGTETVYPFFFAAVLTFCNYISVGRDPKMPRRHLLWLLPFWYTTSWLIARFVDPVVGRTLNSFFD